MFVISSIGSLAECVTSNLPKSLQSRHTSQSFSYIFSLLLLLHLSIQSEPYDLGINPDSVLSRRWHQSVYLKPSITVHKSINLFNFHSLLLLPPVTPPKTIKPIYCPLLLLIHLSNSIRHLAMCAIGSMGFLAECVTRNLPKNFLFRHKSQ